MFLFFVCLFFAERSEATERTKNARTCTARRPRDQTQVLIPLLFFPNWTIQPPFREHKGQGEWEWGLGERIKHFWSWASLVAQWLRIRLPMQGTRVWALIREDPTCRGATKPVRHNYWAHTPQLLKPACLEPVLRNKRSHRNGKPAHKSSPRSLQLEKAHVQQRRPNAAKNK